jgi:hypothetical protein
MGTKIVVLCDCSKAPPVPCSQHDYGPESAGLGGSGIWPNSYWSVVEKYALAKGRFSVMAQLKLQQENPWSTVAGFFFQCSRA